VIIQRIQWLAAVALTCVLAGPVLSAQGAEHPIDGAVFNLRSGAGIATFNPDSDQRIHARFAGKGKAKLSADGVRLALGPMTQVHGDRTLTVTPVGPLTRRGQSRVFVGHGMAQVGNAGEGLTFERVRIVIKLRGHGERLRMIGKFRGKNGPRVDEGLQGRPAVLYGRFHGQRVVPEPSPA
jgi:hypothetical protein